MIGHFVADRVIVAAAGDFFIRQSLLGRVNEKLTVHLVEVVGQGIILHALQKACGQLRLHFSEQKIERFIVMIKGLFVDLRAVAKRRRFGLQSINFAALGTGLKIPGNREVEYKMPAAMYR